MSPEIITAAPRPDACDAGWLLGYLGTTQVVYMDGRVTDRSFDAYVTALCRDIDQRDEREKVGVVYHVPQPSALGSARRRKLGEALKRREAKLALTTSAYAMATPSAVVRSGLRMLFWLAPPPYPNAIVSNPLEAFEFVARYQRGIDPELLARELATLCAAAEPAMAAP